MKKISLFLFFLVIFSSCSNDDEANNEENSNNEVISDNNSNPEISDLEPIEPQEQPPEEVGTRPVGSSFCGPFETSEPIKLVGMDNITISGLVIANAESHCIEISNCNNVIIENCKLGSAVGSGIHIFNSTNITIRQCSISNVQRGVNAVQSSGISVTNNDVINVQGPANPGGQMVQFNNVTGPGNEINFNVSENFLGESDPEDVINMFQTTGTVLDPVQIKGNWIRGGGPSPSGGGILVGDVGGANFIVEDNILVNPGQYGISVVSGMNSKVLRNKIFGKQQSFTNVGIAVWNAYDPEHECTDVTVSGNEVSWINRDGIVNPLYNSMECGIVTDIDNNIWRAAIDETILPVQMTLECISFP